MKELQTILLDGTVIKKCVKRKKTENKKTEKEPHESMLVVTSFLLIWAKGQKKKKKM